MIQTVIWKKLKTSLFTFTWEILRSHGYPLPTYIYIQIQIFRKSQRFICILIHFQLLVCAILGGYADIIIYNIYIIRLQLLYMIRTRNMYLRIFSVRGTNKNEMLYDDKNLHYIPYIYDKRQKKKNTQKHIILCYFIYRFIYILSITMNSCSGAGNLQPTLISCEKIECSYICVKCHRGFFLYIYCKC